MNILFLYLGWQFFDVPGNIFTAWRNCLKFNLNYWSVPTLLKTLFSHWRRYRYSYGRSFEFGRNFEAFTFNMISRGIGAILRSVFIILGLFTEIFVVLVGIIVLLFWIFLPIFLIGGFYYGFKILL